MAGGEKTYRGKDLAGRRPAGKRPSGGKSAEKRPAGKRPAGKRPGGKDRRGKDRSHLTHFKFGNTHDQVRSCGILCSSPIPFHTCLGVHRPISHLQRC